VNATDTPTTAVTGPSVADAVAVAEVGVKVHPVRHDSKARLHTVADWPPSDDPADIAARWPADRRANIGVALDGLVLVDLDVKHGKNGLAEWERLCAGCPVPRTWTVRTGTGGVHNLFLLPPGKTYADRTDVWPGVDIKSGPRSQSLAPGSVVKGRPYSAVDLVSPADAPTWLLADWVPLGAVSVLAGPPGLGKTTYGAWLCARVTRGELPSDLSDQPASVVYATFEDDVARTLVPRFAAAGADLSRVYTVRVGDDAGVLTLPRDVQALTERMTEVGARLLILDPIVAALSSTTDAHKDAHVRRALAPLATLAAGLDAAVVAVMHLNKGNSTDLLTRVSGSIAFGAAARCVLGVVPNPHDDTARLVGIAKSNLGNDHQPARRYVITPATITTDDGQTVETSRVDWRGESTTTLADALSTADEFEREDQDDAAEWLDAYLIKNGGTAPAKDIEEAGRAAKHAIHTLRRAAKRIGVTREKTGMRGGWVWRHPADRPEDDSKTPEDDEGDTSP
jgi:AAA domain/Bifunctional DNA primase/polymerase, N-terminal